VVLLVVLLLVVLVLVVTVHGTFAPVSMVSVSSQNVPILYEEHVVIDVIVSYGFFPSMVRYFRFEYDVTDAIPNNTYFDFFIFNF